MDGVEEDGRPGSAVVFVTEAAQNAANSIKGGIMITRTNPTARRPRFPLKRFAVLTTIVLLVSTRATFAGFTGPNAGSVAGITYNVDTVNAGGGAQPIYGANNDLQNISALPGAGAYGNLAPGPNVNVSNPSGGIAAPNGPLVVGGVPQVVTGAQAPVANVNGSSFGDTVGGNMNVFSTIFGGGSGAGVFWPNPTFLADSGPDGKASVALARGDSFFSDPTGDAAKVPFVALAVSGTLGGQGPAGAFLAAALDATFTIRNAPANGGGIANTFNASVALVTDGNGPKADIITATGRQAGDTFLSGGTGFGTNSFYEWGELLLPALAIPVGGTVEVNGTLSYVADPPLPSDVFLTADVLPPGTPMGDFGPVAVGVPEPASIVLLGLGTLTTLGVCWRRRRETTVRVDRK